MIVKIKEHIVDTFNSDIHNIKINFEQEKFIKNNVTCNITIKNSDYPNILCQDELYTLAMMKCKDEAIRVFSEVNYVDEDLNPENFSYIKPYPKKIKTKTKNIIKEKNKILNYPLSFEVLDQYNKVLDSPILELKEEKEGVSLIGGKILKIETDDITKIRIFGKYENIFNDFEFFVSVTEKEITEIEKLSKMVNSLLLETILNNKKIEELKNRLNNKEEQDGQCNK